MASKNSKPRKPHEHLDKVPKYETQNSLTGYTHSSGRAGHEFTPHEKPGRFGAFVLRCLGKKPKPKT